MVQADHSSTHCGHHGLLVAVSAVDAFDRVVSTMCCPFCSLWPKAVMGLYVGRYYELLAWVFILSFAIILLQCFGSNFCFIPWWWLLRRLEICPKSWGSNASGRTVVGTGETLKGGKLVLWVFRFSLQRKTNSWSISLSCRTSGTYGFQRTCTHLHGPPIHYRTSSSMASSRRPEPKTTQWATLWHHWRCEKNPENHEILWTCNCLNSAYAYPCTFMFIYPSILSQEIWEQKNLNMTSSSCRWDILTSPSGQWSDARPSSFHQRAGETRFIGNSFDITWNLSWFPHVFIYFLQQTDGRFLFLCWSLIRPCATLFSTISAVTRQCQTLKRLKMTCQALPPREIKNLVTQMVPSDRVRSAGGQWPVFFGAKNAVETTGAPSLAIDFRPGFAKPLGKPRSKLTKCCINDRQHNDQNIWISTLRSVWI